MQSLLLLKNLGCVNSVQNLKYILTFNVCEIVMMTEDALVDFILRQNAIQKEIVD